MLLRDRGNVRVGARGYAGACVVCVCVCVCVCVLVCVCFLSVLLSARVMGVSGDVERPAGLRRSVDFCAISVLCPFGCVSAGWTFQRRGPVGLGGFVRCAAHRVWGVRPTHAGPSE